MLGLFIKHLKKGVSIVEVVIAMAVIAILTISTISVIQIGKTKSNEALYFSESRSICNNAYEAFKYANDYNSYNDLNDNIGSAYTSLNEDNGKYTITYVTGVYTLTINLEWNSSGDTFKAICVDKNNETVYETSYSKMHEGASV